MNTQRQTNKDHKIVKVGSVRHPSTFLVGISTYSKGELYSDTVKLLMEKICLRTYIEMLLAVMTSPDTEKKT